MRKLTVINESEIRYLQEQMVLGNEKAFRRIFDIFSENLFRFAFAIIKTRDGATEVVDEVFVNIWKQRSTVNTIGFLKTYLYTSVKNSALNYLSRKAKEQITESFDFIDIKLQDDQCPYQRMITADILQRIQEAVNELPPRCKIIFKLVREDGLKYKEVADILNISVNTVDAQMVIAVKKISEKLRPHFEFFPSPEKKVKNL